MQRLAIVITMVFCSCLALAQEFTFSTANPVSNYHLATGSKPESTKVSIPGLRMRNTGRTLTVCGGVLMIGGIILMNQADQLYYTTTSTQHGVVEEGDARGALGVLMTIGGAGMAVPGIIFWSKGQKKYNRYLERTSASLGFGSSGLALRYSF